MSVNFKYVILGESMDTVINKVTEHFKQAGFGVLTQIDFADKIKEKLGVEIPQTRVVGVCNAELAYQVYQKTTDFLSLIPCNIVVRFIGNKQYSVEMIKPSERLGSLHNEELSAFAKQMDDQMYQVLTSLS